MSFMYIQGNYASTGVLKICLKFFSPLLSSLSCFLLYPPLFFPASLLHFLLLPPSLPLSLSLSALNIKDFSGDALTLTKSAN